MGTPTKTDLLRVGPEHDAILSEFFRAVWDANSTPERVAAARASSASENVASPGEPAPAFIFTSDERAVGYVGSIPIKLWDGRSERGAYWAKGLMVLPEFRKGPIGYLLLKEAVRHLQCAMAATVVPASRKLFEALGFSNLGVLQNYVRVLRPGGFLKKLNLERLGISGIPSWAARGLAVVQRSGIAPLVGAGMRAADAVYVGVRRGPVGALQVGALHSLDAPEVTGLWNEVRAEFASSPVRDSTYLARRYAGGAEGTYRFVAVRQSVRIRALAVVRRPSAEGDPRLAGIRVATLSDLLYSPADARSIAAVLSGADRIARDMGAEALLCSATHASLTRALPRLGYVGIGGNIHFLFRDVSGEGPTARTLSLWHLMRGDSGADEVF